MPFMPRYFLLVLSILLSGVVYSCNGNTDPVQTDQPNDSITDVGSALYQKYNLDKIKLPRGFRISVYAEVPGARSMTLSPSGILYVGSVGKGNVYAVVDNDHNGKAEKVYTIASGLNSPNGVAFKDGSLYIATISTIYRLDQIETRLTNPPKPVKVYDKYPSDRHHGWKFIAFGPDGKLYIPVGMPCNICKKENPIYGTITRMNPDGSGMEIYATGVRNTVGFSWHPETHQLWFTDNGRDNMGDDIPSDELNHAPVKGMNFGFPYCHEGDIPDPEFGKEKNCNEFTPPVQKLGAHVASLGMRFYTGKQFPKEYLNQIFIAEHGSWNRSKPIGYRVALAKISESGKSMGNTIFADGWLQPNGKVIGRPVDVQVLADGSLLVSDDYADVIYRISYKG